MKRLLTAAIGVPVSLAAIFLLTPWTFFGLCAFLFGWVATEFVAIGRAWAPRAPLIALPPLAIATAAVLTAPQALSGALRGSEAALRAPALPAVLLPALALLLSIGVASLVLLGRTPVRESLPALGTLAFGIPYIALPIAALSHLQRRDPWLVFLLIAIVWLGDSAAYYVGRAFGRHKLAPVVSPNKSWEGAIASLVTSAVATAVWSYFYLDRIEISLVALGVVVNLAAQLGDLVESMLKRGAGIKDSGNVLPGHGGMLDRADALLFAAPVLWLGLLLLGPATLLP